MRTKYPALVSILWKIIAYAIFNITNPHICHFMTANPLKFSFVCGKRHPAWVPRTSSPFGLQPYSSFFRFAGDYSVFRPFCPKPQYRLRLTDFIWSGSIHILSRISVNRLNTFHPLPTSRCHQNGLPAIKRVANGIRHFSVGKTLDCLSSLENMILIG